MRSSRVVDETDQAYLQFSKTMKDIAMITTQTVQSSLPSEMDLHTLRRRAEELRAAHIKAIVAGIVAYFSRNDSLQGAEIRV